MPQQNKALALIAVCLGFFMVITDVMIVNIALPNLAKDLHGSMTNLQWVVDGYTLTFACLLLSAGNLGDRIGAKKLFLWGLMIFVGTSIGCGLATNFLFLTTFRFLQGIGASLLVPTSLALINSAYENKEERAKAIGIWGGIGGIAAAAAPVLGAVLTSLFSWRAVFFVNIPIGLFSFLLTLKYVPTPTLKENKSGFDLSGQLMGIISIAALAFSLIEAGRYGWFSEIVIIGFGIFVVTFIAFLRIEHRSTAPMFPLSLFRSSTFSASIAVGMIINMGAYGIFFVMPLYFQQLRGYSVLMTGLALLPTLGVTAIGSYLGGKITSVIGPRLPMLIGLIIGMSGFFCLLIVGEHTPPYWVLVLPLLAIGFGPSLTMPAATIATINATPEDRAGLGAGAFNASRQVGSLIGVAIFGTVITTTSHFILGMHVNLLIAGTAFLGACILTVVYVSGKRLNST